MFLPLTFLTGKNACTLLNLFWAFITANISCQPLIPKINLIRLWSVSVTRQNIFYSKAFERNISHSNCATPKWEIFCWQIYSFQFQRQVKEFCNEQVTLSCAYMNFRERKIFSVVICGNRSTSSNWRNDSRNIWLIDWTLKPAVRRDIFEVTTISKISGTIWQWNAVWSVCIMCVLFTPV